MSKHVQAKARRLLDKDCVTLTRLDPKNGIVYGDVQGDHGTYQSQVTMQGAFNCTCRWGNHNSSGSHHLCSHALALKIAVGF